MCTDRILRYSQSTIKRLRSLNEINLIPQRLLMAKNTSENHVAPMVLEFLTDHVKYGYLNSDELKMLTEEVFRDVSRTRMREFVEKKRSSSSPCSKLDSYDNSDYVTISSMPHKQTLINVFISNGMPRVSKCLVTYDLSVLARRFPNRQAHGVRSQANRARSV